jgi:hypothetical protein
MASAIPMGIENSSDAALLVIPSGVENGAASDIDGQAEG